MSESNAAMTHGIDISQLDRKQATSGDEVTSIEVRDLNLFYADKQALTRYQHYTTRKAGIGVYRTIRLW